MKAIIKLCPGLVHRSRFETACQLPSYLVAICEQQFDPVDIFGQYGVTQQRRFSTDFWHCVLKAQENIEMDPAGSTELSPGAKAVLEELREIAADSRRCIEQKLYCREGRHVILFDTAEEQQEYLEMRDKKDEIAPGVGGYFTCATITPRSV